MGSVRPFCCFNATLLLLAKEKKLNKFFNLNTVNAPITQIIHSRNVYVIRNLRYKNSKIHVNWLIRYKIFPNCPLWQRKKEKLYLTLNLCAVPKLQIYWFASTNFPFFMINLTSFIDHYCGKFTTS